MSLTRRFQSTVSTRYWLLTAMDLSRISITAALSFALFTSSSLAAEPMLEKIDIFEAGKDDYALYRIPGIVVTAKGTALAYCEARLTSASDWGTIDIMLRRSTDG